MNTAPRWKLIGDLKPDDIIGIVEPSGRARVLKVYESDADAKHPKTGVITNALIVCFEMIDGVARGRRDHCFGHPMQKVVTP